MGLSPSTRGPGRCWPPSRRRPTTRSRCWAATPPRWRASGRSRRSAPRPRNQGDLPAGLDIQDRRDSGSSRHGDGSARDRVPDPEEFDLPRSSATISNAGGGVCNNGRSITLLQAFIVSCNTTFADLSIQVGAEDIQITAEALDFNVESPSPDGPRGDLPGRPARSRPCRAGPERHRGTRRARHAVAYGDGGCGGCQRRNHPHPLSGESDLRRRRKHCGDIRTEPHGSGHGPCHRLGPDRDDAARRR